MDVRNYFIEKEYDFSMTRQGYTKQRMNLNLETFKALHFPHVFHIYQHEELIIKSNEMNNIV